jgi:hypothetical protein
VAKQAIERRSILLINVVAAGIEGSIPTPVLAASGGFNITGSMNATRIDFARFSHTMTLLPNGEELVAGGFYEPQPGYLRVLSGAEPTPRNAHEEAYSRQSTVRIPEGELR